MSKSNRYTIAIDFDGVLHAYTTPWVNPHTIPDGPVPGAIEWLHDMASHFDVVIHSTRAQTWRGRRAMRRWITEQGCTCPVKFWYKVKATIYVDDRGYRFTGENWLTAKDVHKMKPWNKYAGIVQR